MALPENVPVATVEFDRPRRMAFTLGAMRRIKEATGTSITAIQDMAEDEGALLENLPGIVWAMLVNEDREGVSVADVEEWVHPGNLNEVVGAFSGLVSGAQPEAGASEGANPHPAPPKVRRGKK